MILAGTAAGLMFITASMRPDDQLSCEKRAERVVHNLSVAVRNHGANVPVNYSDTLNRSHFDPEYAKCFFDALAESGKGRYYVTVAKDGRNWDYDIKSQ